MGWVVAIYTAIGVWRALVKVVSDDPTEKPLWMTTEKNVFVWALSFAFYVVLWPFVALKYK